MNDMASVAKTIRKRTAKAKSTTQQIVPSSPKIVPLERLFRAPENVRHTRLDEDIENLAGDIAAHGLLQSLIGYEQASAPSAGKAPAIMIVGGGRRLQALRALEEDGVIDGDFPVPVLIRDADDALELSLAENLQQRSMSPVDEFVAFSMLMQGGTNSPATLAKRFGFSERVVKQRLRLAELAPEILDALAERKITLDSAMAYAATQDRKLQADVFKLETKKPWEPHKPQNIRWAFNNKGARQSDPLFRYVGEAAYRAAGGDYEDDLFNEDTTDRLLTNPGLLRPLASERIDSDMRLKELDFRQDPELSPTIVGYVKVADLRVKGWGTSDKFTAPAGFVAVTLWDPAKIWKTIRNNRIDCHVVVGINDEGQLAAYPRIIFVPKEHKNAVCPPQSISHQIETPEERAAAQRKRDIDQFARRRAVPSAAGSALDGRLVAPERWEDRQEETIHNGKRGWLVTLKVFVTEEEVAAARDGAEAAYDQQAAEKAAIEQAAEEAYAAATARLAALLGMDPPAVVAIDGQAWFRDNEGGYAPESDDAEPFTDWASLVQAASDDAIEIGGVFASIEDFRTVSAEAEQPELETAA